MVIDLSRVEAVSGIVGLVIGYIFKNQIQAVIKWLQAVVTKVVNSIKP